MTFITQELNVRGLDGILPILCTQEAMIDLDCGDVLMVSVTDADSMNGLEAFCQQSGNKLLQRVDWDGECTFLIRKTS